MPPILIADLEQVIGALMGLLFLVFWIIGQLRDANKKAPPQRGQQPAGTRPQQQPQRQQQPAAQPQSATLGPQPRPQRAEQPRPQAPGAGQANQQADPLREQVEAFLRRAGQPQQPNQPRAPQRPNQQRAKPIEVLVDDVPLTPVRRSLSEPFRPMNQPATGPLQQPSAMPRRPRQLATEPPRTSLAEQASQRVSAGSQGLSQKSVPLGQRIIAEDQQFDDQLKSRFDHTLGTLSASRTVDTAATTLDRNTPAGQFAAMLASPEGVRQAMIVNEILNRPSDRW